MQRAPLAPLALSLLAGIVTGNLYHIEQPLPLIVTVMVVVASFFLSSLPRLQATLVCGAFFTVGVVIAPRPVAPPQPPFQAVVVSEPAERAKSVAVLLAVPESRQRQQYYIASDSAARSLQLGDAIVVEYARQTYIPSRAWHRGGHAADRLAAVDRLRLWALQWRHRLLARYRQTAPSPDDYGVLTAMTLGDKSALTPARRQLFSATGAAHVLALSGLHLGIIYMLLSRLLPGRRRPLRRLVLIAAVWTFALLTGLSVSVVRAATMLTVFALVADGGRQRGSLNKLCLTFIIMMCFDSSQLTDVGFQLSFAAVLSILLLTPRFDRLVSAEYLFFHPVQRWLWHLLSTSVAAQVGTAPLVAYYFGALPTYFLLTNLLVVPLVTVILYVAFFFLVTTWSFAADILALLLTAMHSGLTWLARLPGSTISGLHPTAMQVVMVYAVLASLWLVAVVGDKAKNRQRKFA